MSSLQARSAIVRAIMSRVPLDVAHFAYRAITALSSTFSRNTQIRM